MLYFQIKKEIKNIVRFNLSEVSPFLLKEIIKNYTVTEKKQKPANFYFQSSHIEEIFDEVYKLINKDFEEIINDFDFKDFEVSYFFWKKSPATQLSSFSCELINPDGGKVIYDVVRLVRFEEVYFLILPE